MPNKWRQLELQRIHHPSRRRMRSTVNRLRVDRSGRPRYGSWRDLTVEILGESEA